MKRHQGLSQAKQQQQIFLLEKDTGVLCRILGLYAARGIVIDALHFAHAAPQTMALTIMATADDETLRVLVEKGASLYGVVEAALQIPMQATIQTSLTGQA
jgi:acetolactate synthase small subunit